MDHQHVLRQAVFLNKFLPQGLHFSGKQGMVASGRWSELHGFGSLCISKVWFLNFFLVKRTLKQELQVKEASGKRDREEFDQHALLHHQALLHYTLSPFLLLLLLLILLLLLLFKEVWKASTPSLLSCRDL